MGQPKRFKSGEEMIKLFSEFCNEIADSEYMKVPTQTEFCRWLHKNYKDTDRRTIYNSLNEYFPDIKKEFEQIQSDTIAQGGMLGRYQNTMSIFALKNWCNWKDKSDVSTDAEIKVSIAGSLREYAE